MDIRRGGRTMIGVAEDEVENDDEEEVDEDDEAEEDIETNERG